MNTIPKEKIEELRAYPLNIRLRLLRGFSGYTQVEFGNLIGINKASISQWECGYAYPSNKSLMKIIQVFNLPCDLFFNMENIQNT